MILLGTAAWVGTRALLAKDNLEAALPLVSQIKAEILAGDSAAATKSVAAAAAKISDAKSLTSDPVWRLAELIPVAGGNLRSVRELTDIANGVFVDAVTPLSSVAKSFSPESLKPKDGAIDVASFVAARPAVAKATAALLAAQKKIQGLDASDSIPQVRSGVEKLASMIDGIVPQLQLANKALGALPGLLGETAPRNYLLVFQNSAEPRALGGTTGAIVLVTVENGRIQLGQQASGLDFTKYASPAIAESDDVASIYGGLFATDILNSTVTPSFSVSAQTVRAMWKDRFGVEVDGVASMDPGALALLIKATGPVNLATGDVLNAGNTVSMLLNGIYERYPGLSTVENIKQDAFFGAAVSATFDKITSGGFDPKVLVKSLAQGVNDRRISFWSGHKGEQAFIEELGLTPEVPTSDAHTDHAGLYIADAVGSKLGYYLKQKITVAQGVCRADGRQTYRISLDLTSSVPANPRKSVPAYVLGEYKRERLDPGMMRLDVLAYAPAGSTIVAGSVGGAAFDPGTLKDGVNPVSKVRFQIAPGQTTSVIFEMVAAKPGDKAFDVQITPLVHATPIVKAEIDCSTVTPG